MSININYLNKSGNNQSSNVVLFSNDKFSLKGLEKFLTDKEYSYINDLLKTIDLKKNLFVFEVNSKKK